MVVVLMSAGGVVGIPIATFVIGLIVGIFAAFAHFKKHIKENPPISESQVRELYRQTGKKLSEAQLMRIMKNLQQKD